MKRELIVSADVCALQLRLYRRVRRLKSYDHDPGGSGDLEAVLWDGRREIPARSVDEVLGAVRRAHCDVAGEVAKDPRAIAAIFGHLLAVGRVVVETELYSFLDEAFEVITAQAAPRVHAGKLLFLAGEFGRVGTQNLEEISVDLTTGRVTRTPIRRREKDRDA